MKKGLTEKERLFCFYFAEDGDARGCAARAGFSVAPKRSAARLLGREEIRAEIAKLEKEKKAVNAVEKGLMRLAFGSVADAMRLMLCEDSLTADEIEKLDLFNVSEIKRPKGGGLEIKFFDRLRALEKLGADAREDNAGVAGLMEAIGRGAMAAGGEEDD